MVLGFVGLTVFNQPDDKTLIREAIQEAAKASKEGRPGGVFDYLSSSFSVNDTEVTGNRRDANKFIKDLRPNFEFTSVEPILFDGEAKVESPVKVTLGLLGATKTFDLPSATITLKQETGRNFFVIPVKQWRITNISIPPESFASFMSGGMF